VNGLKCCRWRGIGDFLAHGEELGLAVFVIGHDGGAVGSLWSWAEDRIPTAKPAGGAGLRNVAFPCLPASPEVAGGAEKAFANLGGP
jgi:hypothetical protein